MYRLHVEGFDADFASMALRAPRVRQEIETIARGTSRSMAKLRGEDIASLDIPAVELSKQQAIGQQDIAARAVLRSRRGELERSVEMLTEYKQSLITAAVTGEFDVTSASGRGMPGADA